MKPLSHFAANELSAKPGLRLTVIASLLAIAGCGGGSGSADSQGAAATSAEALGSKSAGAQVESKKKSAAASTEITAAAATATSALVDGAVVQLANACSGKVLDVAGISQDSNVQSIIWTDLDGANQQWRVTVDDDGAVSLTAMHSGKVLDARGNQNGSPVAQNDADGTSSQKWQISAHGTNVKFTSRYARAKALDVSGASTDDGAKVQLWQDNGTCAQRWKVLQTKGQGEVVNSPPPVTGVTGSTIFGLNDGSGYNNSLEFNREVSADLKRLGMTAARMGADYIGCERVGEPCNFTDRDVAVQAHLDQGIALHMTIAFRSQLDWAGGEQDQWAQNYGWKCGQIAAQYKNKVRYYIVDNEVDLSYGSGQQAKVTPELAVKMQKSCYEAIKKVDAGILVESTPAMSPWTPFNRDLLRNGIANYADIIGTHMYGGQLRDDSMGKLAGYMAEFGVNKPIACSECGDLPTWTEGTRGQQVSARAKWIRDIAVLAKKRNLHNVLYFSWKSIHGDWEMNGEPEAEQALYDVGHGKY